ncbi:MAG TPA: response regulator [Coleofasciculaceae cyanobacterium]|jgi:chemotaxis family two-component system response regulator PixG
MLIPLSIRSLKPVMTTDYEIVTIGGLSDQIQICRQEQFSGRLDLTNENSLSQKWSLYFSGGGLVWATSQVHPIRRWCRQLAWHCPQLIVEEESKPLHVPDYDSLAELARQGKIRQEQLQAIIEGQIVEILFDIIQAGESLGYRSAEKLTYRTITVDNIDSKLFVTPVDQVWRSALKFWEAWQRAGLEGCSPNLAPVILKAERLQELTSPIVYRNLTTQADGYQTFRDLAVKMNRNLVLLTKPVMPCIRQGLIGLTEVEDVRCSVKTFTATTRGSALGATSVNSQHQSTSPLVAYIDDSRTDSLTMTQILTEAGYRCINIQDPVQALPMLIENKPDLIFLDLVMPIANGYEICTQIRRVSAFKDTPIIILTSNDGIVDRVRAKMVGSSGFLAKPINTEKVLNILHLHLQKSPQQPTPVPSQKLSIVGSWSPEQKILSLD